MRERLKSEAGDLMIVTHLPYLSRLLSLLLGVQPERTLVNVQMGGVVHMERDTNRECRLHWILVPELLSERTTQQQSAT